MFTRLFAQSGLSLDRLRTLVEVGASGSIVRAAGSDPIRQSLYSRQIKELEGFFQIRLVERQGKGVRLTASGRELARISRFFLLGLSNFQRGCVAEDPVYRLGAGPTFTAELLMKVLASLSRARAGMHFAVESVGEEEIERRLHDLTLDFGVVSRGGLSRPLQVKELGRWRWRLWVPRTLAKSEALALKAFREERLPLVWPAGEAPFSGASIMEGHEPVLECGSFLEAKAALEQGAWAALLPEFLQVPNAARGLWSVALPGAVESAYCLAWNPRLLRLNPHAARRRDALIDLLARALKAATPGGSA